MSERYTMQKLPYGVIYYYDGNRLLEEHQVLARLNELTAQRDELEKWRLAVENMTPGGSEFYRDLGKCLEYLQDVNEVRQGIKARMLARAKTAEAQRDAAVEALKQIANELAAIHPYPDNPGLMEWPVTGEADALCLHTAYDTAKAAIAAAGETA
jgi:hypothetical protein